MRKIKIIRTRNRDPFIGSYDICEYGFYFNDIILVISVYQKFNECSIINYNKRLGMKSFRALFNYGSISRIYKIPINDCYNNEFHGGIGTFIEERDVYTSYLQIINVRFQEFLSYVDMYCHYDGLERYIKTIYRDWVNYARERGYHI